MKSLEALRILCECANGEKKLLFSDSLDLEKIIKQDLEVLEIIRKKKVDVNDIYMCDRYELYIIYMKNLEIAEESILTLQEFNKLKQWLEGNENEN